MLFFQILSNCNEYNDAIIVNDDTQNSRYTEDENIINPFKLFFILYKKLVLVQIEIKKT